MKTVVVLLSLALSANSFSTLQNRHQRAFVRTTSRLQLSSSDTAAVSFIDSELRGAAMRLHTRQQAPREGKVQTPEEQPYVTTHADYLQFLVDSQYVYQALEDIVNEKQELSVFRNTALERVQPLEKDIAFMCQEYGLERPQVGKHGIFYAQHLKSIESIPELMCHYYNWYFAHTAGGRMIGKQMAALLLDKRTLEFYKWNGDLNEIKAAVKESIEEMAANWSPSERQECIDATAMAFQGGGGVNACLRGQGGSQ